jgi:hypothetical protein
MDDFTFLSFAENMLPANKMQAIYHNLHVYLRLTRVTCVTPKQPDGPGEVNFVQFSVGQKPDNPVPK